MWESMQISRLITYGLLMMVALTVFFSVPGEKGLVKAYHLKQELATLNAENVALRQENETLAQEARLLRENLPYIEHVITKEMNLVRPGDTIVVIKKKKN
jgi:cell division protein FtsB